MIIFDLDGTLANCDHRRHFVDASYRTDCYYHFPATLSQSEGWFYKDRILMCEPPKAIKFIPDWKAFNEACDKDEPIQPVMDMFCRLLAEQQQDIEVWSGRCQSVEDKTVNWLRYHLDDYFGRDAYIKWKYNIKMRPIGDSTPDDQLKERWLNERCSDLIEAIINDLPHAVKHDVEFVFDDRPKVIRMWRRRGIFVFNCCKHDREF